MAQALTAGQRVWVPDQERAWALAEVTGADGARVRVRRLEDGGEAVVDGAGVHLCNSAEVEDMTSLAFLHEPGVLWNLQARYEQRLIYTYTGNILIALNPFQPLPDLYGTSVLDAYRAAPRGVRLAPHVYATACAAYRAMLTERAGQAILVTGESGAGKTETAKLIMAALTHLGAHSSGTAASEGGSGSPDGGVSGVEQKILESNPLLEAFGNAKTLRNHNSSRFGKYVELRFCAASGAVAGAAVRTYLLERSRVVAVNNPERSFHIFYQLVYGASPAERAAWRLPPSAAGFAYLARSSCVELPGQSNAEEYQHTRRAMTHIGLSTAQQEAVLRCVAAVLHLGNIAFVDDAAAGGGGGAEAATVAPGGAAAEALAVAAELLGVEGSALAEALTSKQIATPEGSITTPLSAQAAAETRDAMAKALYARLFDWLVGAINAAVHEAHGGNGNGAANGNGVQQQQQQQEHLTIGLLDIYGFESFETNDLEQLCINLTNEKLQQHFNQHVFKWEQAEYEREGVDWSYISFRDNADVLELLEGRLGLMDLLDEACRFPRATPEDLALKYGSSAVVAGSGRFARLKRPATSFAVEHYAGSVTYSTTNFLDKNRDYVVAEHSALLSRSSQPLVAQLFAPDDAASGPAPPGSGGGANGAGAMKSQFQFRSVTSQCRKQLAELMTALSAMQPHYVRCVKPNAAGSAAAGFSPPYSLSQLRCGGVMEAVRIACAGYSYRRPYAAFLDHFWQLCPEPVHALRRRAGELRRPGGGPALSAAGGRSQQQQQQPGGDLALLGVEELRAAAAALMEAAAAGPQGQPDGSSSGGLPYHLGVSKVFLRATAAAALERQRAAREAAAAATIQAHQRRRVAQREFAVARAAAITIQAHCRGLLARRLAERLRRERAAMVVQRAWRGCVERLRFRRLRAAAALLQAAWRAAVVRRNVQAAREAHAALVVQCAWRMSVVRREYLGVLRFWRAAVRVQAAWRGYAARQLYSQILPLHRAALASQRVWRAHRRGAQLSSRLRTALLTYWLHTKAAVIIQAAWRGKAARQVARKLRQQQRRARFLALWGGGVGGGGGDAGAAPLRHSPDAVRRQDAPRTPYARPRGLFAAKAAAAAEGGAEGGPAGAGVVRNDVAAHPDCESRVRARLAEMQHFKVTPLLQYWQQHASAVDAGAAAPPGPPPRPGASSCSASSSRPGTADAARRRSSLGTHGGGMGGGGLLGRGTPRTGGRGSGASFLLRDELPSPPGSPPDASIAGGSGVASRSSVGGGGGEEGGVLSCEPSYGQLLSMGAAAGCEEAGAPVAVLA